MRDNGPTILHPANGAWTRAPGRLPASESQAGDVDSRFIRHLVTMLDAAKFGNLAFAILRASVQVGNGEAGREEFDTLVDFGVDILARNGRPLHLVQAGR
jgi:hypothetical protein